jgi:hypothetical protein
MTDKILINYLSHILATIKVIIPMKKKYLAEINKDLKVKDLSNIVLEYTAESSLDNMICDSCKNKSKMLQFSQDGEEIILEDGQERWSIICEDDEVQDIICFKCGVYYIICKNCSNVIEDVSDEENKKYEFPIYLCQFIGHDCWFSGNDLDTTKLIKETDKDYDEVKKREYSAEYKTWYRYKNDTDIRYIKIKEYRSFKHNDMDMRNHEYNENDDAYNENWFVDYSDKKIRYASDELISEHNDQEGITGPDGGFMHAWKCNTCEKIYQLTDK